MFTTSGYDEVAQFGSIYDGDYAYIHCVRIKRSQKWIYEVLGM